MEKWVARLDTVLPYGKLVLVGKYPTEWTEIMELRDGTYLVDGDKLKVSAWETGYWVAETDHEFDHGATQEELVAIAKRLQDTYDVGHVGVWTNRQGRKVMDATHHVKDLLEAVALGRHWNQEAIWDINHGHNIFIR